MSQMEYIVFGDSEAATVDILQNASEVMAFSPVKITTDLVGYDRGMVWIEVTRQGGSYRFPRQDRPRIDIEVYAPKRSVAHDLIQVCQGVMFREQNNYTGKGVRYVACQVETGIFESTDKLTEEYRYILSLRLIVKPAP